MPETSDVTAPHGTDNGESAANGKSEANDRAGSADNQAFHNTAASSRKSAIGNHDNTNPRTANHIDTIIVSVPQGHMDEFQQMLHTYHLVDKYGHPWQQTTIIGVYGGVSRQQSIGNALQKLDEHAQLTNDDIVLIHDAARCAVPSTVIDSVVQCLHTLPTHACKTAAVIPGVAAVDTMYQARIPAFTVRQIQGETSTDWYRSDGDIQTKCAKKNPCQHDRKQRLGHDSQHRSGGTGTHRPGYGKDTWHGRLGDKQYENAEADSAAHPVNTTKQYPLVERVLPRGELYHVQTPQGFFGRAICDAHERYAIQATNEATAMSDDAQLMMADGGQCFVVEGSAMNLKITVPADIAIVEEYLHAQSESDRPAS
ncbi:MAG: 2-C-methyl-D-erythritol 4-phosphate cytidylyltransferase [Actinomycetaceae bacterium]|nr:2-C-methyl-D-erythritol 4-phosphate cytidylyltransferase [Actinomycetaceae bacterium]